jgi:hypothetical protein
MTEGTEPDTDAGSPPESDAEPDGNAAVDADGDAVSTADPGSDSGSNRNRNWVPDASAETPVRSPAEQTPADEAAVDDRFLLDAMLGKLATYLRMCGHDAAYALDRDVVDDDALLQVTRTEDRQLVTRDVQLAGRADDGLLVESREVTAQLRELAAAGVDLSLASRPARCGACNGPVERVPADASVPETVPDPDETAVWQCIDCGQRFWKGSHWDDVRDRLERL